MPKIVVGSCGQFCWRSLVPFERCANLKRSKINGKFESNHFYTIGFGNKLSLASTLQALVWKQLEIWLPVGPRWFWLAATFPKAVQLFKTFNKRLATKSWLWKNSTSHQWRALDNLPGTSFKTRKGMVIGENASSDLDSILIMWEIELNICW